MVCLYVYDCQINLLKYHSIQVGKNNKDYLRIFPAPPMPYDLRRSPCTSFVADPNDSPKMLFVPSAEDGKFDAIVVELLLSDSDLSVEGAGLGITVSR